MNYNLDDASTSKERTLTICYDKKQNAVSFSCVCPVIDSEFRHNIVSIVCGNSSSDAEQTDEKLTSFCVELSINN